MKISALMIILSCLVLLLSSQAIAEPVVSHDVTVQTNATASQCPSSWEGSSGDEVSETTSGVGQNSVASPTIRSCTNCSVQNGNCVCGTCYDYTN